MDIAASQFFRCEVALSFIGISPSSLSNPFPDHSGRQAALNSIQFHFIRRVHLRQQMESETPLTVQPNRPLIQYIEIAIAGPALGTGMRIVQVLMAALRNEMRLRPFVGMPVLITDPISAAARRPRRRGVKLSLGGMTIPRCHRYSIGLSESTQLVRKY